jgi:hypothetical protein
MDGHGVPSRKNPAVAAGLALIAGPVGFLYIGWRYAIAATVVFVAFVAIFDVLLFVPSWLKYINVAVLAYMAVEVCEIWSRVLDASHPNALALNTFPVAIFSMTSLLPILAAADTAVVGLYFAAEAFAHGELGRALLIAIVATPFLATVHLLGFSIVAGLLDRLVLAMVPTATTNIFPTGRG